MDKGSRQIRSVTSGKGLALRAEPVGLELEAGLSPIRAGWVVRRRHRLPSRVRRLSAFVRRARIVVGFFPWKAPATSCRPSPMGFCPWVGRRRLRQALNSQLRTGTDSGNPTV